MIETSIIIPIHNQAETLLKTLESLQSQIRLKRNFEIVICDDESTDGVGDRLRQLRYPIFFKYLKNNPALGRARNRNHGFKNSSGKRVIFIDGDMVPAPGFIDSYLNFDLAHGVAIGGIKKHPDIESGPFESYLYQRSLYKDKTPDTKLEANFFASGNFMISRELYENLGGFDEAFSIWGGEDLDFGMRLRDAGIDIISLPDALTYHRHQKSLHSMADDFYEFGRHTFEILLLKHNKIGELLPIHRVGIAAPGASISLFDKLRTLAMINRPMLNLAKYLCQSFTKTRWPDQLYSYIIWGSLGLGYKDRKRAENE